MGFWEGEDKTYVTVGASKLMGSDIDLYQIALSKAVTTKVRKNQGAIQYIYNLLSCGGGIIDSYQIKGNSANVTDRLNQTKKAFKMVQTLETTSNINVNYATNCIASILNVSSSALSNVDVSTSFTVAEWCKNYLNKKSGYNYNFTTNRFTINNVEYEYVSCAITYKYTLNNTTYTSSSIPSSYTKIKMSTIQATIKRVSDSITSEEDVPVYPSNTYYKISYTHNSQNKYLIVDSITTYTHDNTYTLEAYPLLTLRHMFYSLNQYNDASSHWLFSKDRYDETETIFRTLGLDLEDMMHNINGESDTDNDGTYTDNGTVDLGKFSGAYLTLATKMYGGFQVDVVITERNTNSENGGTKYYEAYLTPNTEIYEQYGVVKEMSSSELTTYYRIYGLSSKDTPFATISYATYNLATDPTIEREMDNEGNYNDYEIQQQEEAREELSDFNSEVSYYSNLVDTFNETVLSRNTYYKLMSKYYYELFNYYIDHYDTAQNSNLKITTVETAGYVSFSMNSGLYALSKDTNTTSTYYETPIYSYGAYSNIALNTGADSVDTGFQGGYYSTSGMITKKSGYTITTISTFIYNYVYVDATGPHIYRSTDASVEGLFPLIKEGMYQLSPVERAGLYRESVWLIQVQQETVEGTFWDGVFFSIFRWVLTIAMVYFTGPLAGATVITTDMIVETLAMLFVTVVLSNLVSGLLSEISDPIGKVIGTIISMAISVVVMGGDFAGLFKNTITTIITFTGITISLANAYLEGLTCLAQEEYTEESKQIKNTYDAITDSWNKGSDILSTEYLADLTKGVVETAVSPILLSVETLYNLCYKVYSMSDIYDNLYYTDYSKLNTVGFI